jgi:predicted polyphosphate/ATP-dependent NAD kinase
MAAKPVSVGIIANPASGADIRRLVALGSVFGAQEKVNIVRRILVGLEAAGVEQIYLMPDAFGIASQALGKLPAGFAGLRDRAHLLDLPVENGPKDSLRATQEMCTLGVGCIIVLGGDGTNRVVAKGCGQVPILPVSTGTNNVIPYLVEGTVAGLAGGFVAHHPEVLTQVAYRSKRLEVRQDGSEPDVALVDVAVVAGDQVGTRAVWDPSTLRQAIVTRGEPWATGISSLAGFLMPLSPTEPRGLWFLLGEARLCRAKVPLAPGLMASLDVQAIRELSIGDSITIPGGRILLALDGEREIRLYQGQSAQIYLRDDGPWMVDVYRAAQEATKRGFFVRWFNDAGKSTRQGGYQT